MRTGMIVNMSEHVCGFQLSIILLTCIIVFILNPQPLN